MHQGALVPYEGSKPYVFVSYAHKDTKQVLPVLQHLYSQGYRIWFDDGIAPGTEWPQNIAVHLRDCALVMAFISPNSNVSDNCRREIVYAMNLKKPFLGVFLEETDLAEGVEMQIGIHQNIYRYNHRTEQSFLREICECPGLKFCREGDIPIPPPPPPNPSQRLPFGLILTVLAVAAALLIGYNTIHFWSEASCTEASECRICGKERTAATGHYWQAATCISPKTCLTCGETMGEALGHQWVEATYDAPKTCVACGETVGEALDDPMKDLRIGDLVCFGNYEQDNNGGNGKESIEWIVLDKSEDKLLLLSRYGLDSRSYHSRNEYTVTWENCSLRSWLNSTFLSTAFSAEEQKRIVLSRINADYNPVYATNPGNDTDDHLFLLSLSEIKQYYPDYQDRVCQVTSYARSQGAFDHTDSSLGGWWWMRTPGAYGNYVTSINSNGAYDSEGSIVTGEKATIRPAMWIRIG